MYFFVIPHALAIIILHCCGVKSLGSHEQQAGGSTAANPKDGQNHVYRCLANVPQGGRSALRAQTQEESVNGEPMGDAAPPAGGGNEGEDAPEPPPPPPEKKGPVAVGRSLEVCCDAGNDLGKLTY